MADVSSEGVALHKCAECALVHIDKANVARVLAKHGLPGLDALSGKGDGEVHTAACAGCESDNMKQFEGGKEDELQAFDLCDDCEGIQFESQWQDDLEGTLDVRDLGVILKVFLEK